MIRVLLTGFEPFADDVVNPSALAVRRVAAAWSGSAELITGVLPVTFADGAVAIRSLIAEHEPELVIATGLAGNRAAITPERVAVNLIDARVRDNTGAQPVDREVLPNGPAAYFSNLPVKAMVRDLNAAGIPSEISYTAGTFVCNQVFYAAMDEAAGMPRTRAGFVHVPWSSEHGPTGALSLPLDEIVRGLEIAVRTGIRSPSDAAVAGGTIS